MIENAYALVQFLSCCFELYMFYDFLKAFFPLREERRKAIALEALIIASTIYFINGYHLAVLNLICNLVFYFVFTCLVFRMRLRYKVFYTAFSLTVMLIIEFFFELMYTIIGIDIWNAGALEICLSALERVVYFIFLQFLKRQRRECSKLDSYRYLKRLFISPLATFILLNGVLFSGQYPTGDMLLCLGITLLVVSIVVEFGIVEQLTEAIGRTKETEMLLLKGDLEQKHYEQLEQINQEYAKHIHDFKHVLRTIQELAEQEEYSRILILAKEAREKNYQGTCRSYSQNPILNAILLEREREALKKEISIQIDVEPNLDVDFIKDIDMICMFGNLLDNAIEAAIPIRGLVVVSVYMVNDALLGFKVENEFLEKPKLKEGRFLTVKSDQKNHGFGVGNVKEIAERYDGQLVFDEIENHFIATLILSKFGPCAKNGK